MASRTEYNNGYFKETMENYVVENAVTNY